MLEILLQYGELDDWLQLVNERYPTEFHLTCIPEGVDLLSVTDLWPQIDVLFGTSGIHDCFSFRRSMFETLRIQDTATDGNRFYCPSSKPEEIDLGCQV